MNHLAQNMLFERRTDQSGLAKWYLAQTLFLIEKLYHICHWLMTGGDVNSDPENRRSKRINYNSTIMVEEKHSGYLYYGQMINYSVGGIYFESNVDCNPGTQIDIRITDPPFKSFPSRYNGLVVWSQNLIEADSFYSYGVGLKFWEG